MVTSAPFLAPKNPYTEKANYLYENRKIGFLLSLLKTEEKKAVFLEKIQQLEQYRNEGQRTLFTDLFVHIEDQILGQTEEKAVEQTVFSVFDSGSERAKAPRTAAYQTSTLSTIFSFGEEGERMRKSIRETFFNKAPFDRYFQYLSGIGPIGLIDRLNGHLLSRSLDRQYERLKGYWIQAYA